MKADKDLVNKLIRESFGVFYRGDWTIDNNNYSPSGPIIGNRLKIIGMGLDFPFSLLREVGRFRNKYGSAIIVKEKYLNKAQKYAKLYEDATGEKVSIKAFSEKNYYKNIYDFMKLQESIFLRNLREQMGINLIK